MMFIGWILLGFFVYFLLQSKDGNKPFSGDIPSAKPMDILKERFARGEIDEEEYKSKMKVLES